MKKITLELIVEDAKCDYVTGKIERLLNNEFNSLVFTINGREATKEEIEFNNEEHYRIWGE